MPLLHGVELLVVLVLHEPNLAVLAASYSPDEIKVPHVIEELRDDDAFRTKQGGGREHLGLVQRGRPVDLHPAS